MQRGQAVTRKFRIREVTEIEGDDESRPRLDRSRDDMAVVRIGEEDGAFEILVALDKSVENGGAHQGSCTPKSRRVNIRSVVTDASECFIEDSLAPAAEEELLDRRANEEVTERARVEHAGVEHGDRDHR